MRVGIARPYLWDLCRFLQASAQQHTTGDATSNACFCCRLLSVGDAALLGCLYRPRRSASDNSIQLETRCSVPTSTGLYIAASPSWSWKDLIFVPMEIEI